jgi:hypothetical protein
MNEWLQARCVMLRQLALEEQSGKPNAPRRAIRQLHAAHPRRSSQSSDQRSSSFPSTNTQRARMRGRDAHFALSGWEQLSLEAGIVVRGVHRSVRAISMKSISSA